MERNFYTCLGPEEGGRDGPPRIPTTTWTMASSNRAAFSDQDFAANGVMRKTMSASELSMSTSSMNSSSSSSSSPPQVSRRSSLFQKMFRRGSSQKKLQQEEVCVAELCVQDLRYIPRYREPLQYNRQEVMKRERRQSLRRTYSPDSVLDEFTHGTVMALPQKKKKVTFQEDVIVVPIPLRSDYSTSLRAKLWSNIVERCDNEGKRSLYLRINLYSYTPSDPSISTTLYFVLNVLFPPPQNGI